MLDGIISVEDLEEMQTYLTLISKLEPIAVSLLGGFFIFLTVKYILESVIDQVDGIHNIVTALDNRVKTMNRINDSSWSAIVFPY